MNADPVHSHPPKPVFHVRLLGACQVDDARTAPVTLDTPCLQSLFAYLVLHKDGSQKCAKVAATLWPTATADEASANLRKYLHHLRSHLRLVNRYLYADARSLHWDEDLIIAADVLDFERALIAADTAQQQGRASALEPLRRATDLYLGDFLPGCDDAWVTAERTRLHTLHAQALGRLATLLQRDSPNQAPVH